MFVIIVYICFEFLTFFVFLDLFRRIESQLVLLAQEAALKTNISVKVPHRGCVSEGMLHNAALMLFN